MAAKSKAAKAGAAAVAVKNSPYIKALAEDEELRANLYGAYESARSGGGPVAERQASDEAGLRRQEAAEGRQGGGRVVQGGRRRAARGAASEEEEAAAGSASCSCVAIVGAAIALAVSEDLRKKVLDALFGAEEEFEYTSTTSPAPAPETTST